MKNIYDILNESASDVLEKQIREKLKKLLDNLKKEIDKAPFGSIDPDWYGDILSMLAEISDISNRTVSTIDALIDKFYVCLKDDE